ncbi:MAG: lytic murein transglycosylase B [Legionellaceae bacterium]|jgi:membrane-bound lytic murein transglycosylase B|nr:lytic murein transglycosylase B [Legionellaceae bacterium]
MIKQFARLMMIISVMCYAGFSFADADLIKKKAAEAFIQRMVDKHHFKRSDVVSALKQVKFQPRIIELMERPYEKKNWDKYSTIFLTPERLQGGLAFWQENQETLAQAEKKFGVPASVIVSILGVETKYGKYQGTYRVLDAVSTLAFYYPKRASYFTRELEEYLLLCREQGVPVTHYMGSYAGAIGQPQFMPSNYRVYAVDFAGKNHPDLIHEKKDVIFSVANYFKRHGWETNGEVTDPALVKGAKYKALKTNSRRPDYAYKQLLQSGVTPVTPLKNPPKKAGLIELNTHGDAYAYWLAYPNFYVITRYNTSPQYALVVHLLSEQLQQRWDAKHKKQNQV